MDPARVRGNSEKGLQIILLDLMIRHRYVVRTDERKLRFTCTYNRDHSDGLLRCPNNEHGICKMEYTEEDFPWVHVTIYNERKMFHCPCG